MPTGRFWDQIPLWVVCVFVTKKPHPWSRTAHTYYVAYIHSAFCGSWNGKMIMVCWAEQY